MARRVFRPCADRIRGVRRCGAECGGKERPGSRARRAPDAGPGRRRAGVDHQGAPQPTRGRGDGLELRRRLRSAMQGRGRRSLAGEAPPPGAAARLPAEALSRHLGESGRRASLVGALERDQAYNKTMSDSAGVLRSRSNRWTIDRIARLAEREVTQLRTNAEALGDAQVVALCDQVLLLERPVVLAQKAG